MKTLCSLLLLNICVIGVPAAYAQRDRVYDFDGKSVSGEITNISAQGVEMKRSGETQVIKSGEIMKIMFEGDPPGLTRGRELAIDGQYEPAIEELRKIDFSGVDREAITADAVFYEAFATAKLALAGQGPLEPAAKKLLDFARKYSNSYHFFAAAKLLGDLALTLGEHDKAVQYYGSLRKAPDLDTKVESVYLTGVVQLKQGDREAAIADFDKVIGLKAQTARAIRLQALAQANKAVALVQQGKADEGLQILDSLIQDLNPTDLELAARIYNAQGNAHESKGDTEGAILAYLHTHLMFSATPDAHAEALRRLIELWPKVGKPEEASKAQQELAQRYPGF
jgi:tetratricopeptide (TPR) repeat protein